MGIWCTNLVKVSSCVINILFKIGCRPHPRASGNHPKTPRVLVARQGEPKLVVVPVHVLERVQVPHRAVLQEALLRFGPVRASAAEWTSGCWPLIRSSNFGKITIAYLTIDHLSLHILCEWHESSKHLRVPPNTVQKALETYRHRYLLKG